MGSTPHIKDVNTVWPLIKREILNACYKFMPTVKIPTNPSPKWFDSRIRHQINRIRTLRRRTTKTPSPGNMSRLCKMELKLRSSIQSAKPDFISQILSAFHEQPRKLFSYFKDLSKSKFIPKFIIHNDVPIYDHGKIANLFNTFFNSTFTSSNYTLPAFDALPSPSNQLHHIDISSLDVYKALSDLDPTKAFGCDNVHPRVLKHCAVTLTEPITHLCDLSIKNQCIPDEWKLHKICPIPKKGDLTLVKNYRPITLLPIVSKVLERIVYNKIIPFIRPLLSDHQFGFLKNRSCLKQLLVSFAQIFQNVNQGLQTNAIYFDFQKAFDSILHPELLFKFWAIGITGPLWCWFKSYLSNRKHFVQYGNASSDVLPVLSGVPQGSILGPLLFLVFINDLPSSLSFVSPYLFADDTKFLGSSNASSHTQADINSLVSWCQKWNITLNMSKWIVLRVSLSSSTQTYHFSVDGVNIMPTTSTHTDLGIIVSNNLSWLDHYDHICIKAYRALNMIRRVLPANSSTALKKRLYVSLVRSRLTYCSLLWRPRLIKDIKRLEQVQRWCTKFILQDYSSTYKSRLRALNLLPLMLWYELQDIMFLVKCLKEPMDNVNIFDYVQFSTSNTRAGCFNKLIHKLSRTSCDHHFFFNRIVRLWNSMPYIDLTLSFDQIKSKILSHLWSHFTVKFNSDLICTFHSLCLCCKCQS